MNYYIFKEQIFTIFLSLSHLTAITFPDRVQDYVGGTKSEFQIYELNKKKSLVYEPKSNSINRNFIVFLKNSKFHYNIKYNDELSNKDINIHKARKCTLFSLIKETKRYKLFECPKSIFIVNKSSSKLKVNDFYIEKSKYISKGPPIYLNSKLIHYKGRTM